MRLEEAVYRVDILRSVISMHFKLAIVIDLFDGIEQNHCVAVVGSDVDIGNMVLDEGLLIISLQKVVDFGRVNFVEDLWKMLIKLQLGALNSLLVEINGDTGPNAVIANNWANHSNRFSNRGQNAEVALLLEVKNENSKILVCLDKSTYVNDELAINSDLVSNIVRQVLVGWVPSLKVAQNSGYGKAFPDWDVHFPDLVLFEELMEDVIINNQMEDCSLLSVDRVVIFDNDGRGNCHKGMLKEPLYLFGSVKKSSEEFERWLWSSGQIGADF